MIVGLMMARRVARAYGHILTAHKSLWSKGDCLLNNLAAVESIEITFYEER